jgi:biotin carboxyl carrier protein
MTLVRVRIEGEEFTVEVGDVQARPILALVDGQRFEIWPEAAPAVLSSNGSAPAAASTPASHGPAVPSVAPASAGAQTRPAVLAPLPGVVVEVSVQPGDHVAVGQTLVVIEAMKMKNVVRATRAGRIAAVHAGVGQTVQHRALLVEYAPE